VRRHPSLRSARRLVALALAVAVTAAAGLAAAAPGPGQESTPLERRV
jgi:hypothetical protein